MKKYVIDFDLFEAAMHFSGDQDIRHYLNGVRLVRNRIEATNGHIGYMAKFSKSVNLPDFLDDCSVIYDDIIIKPKNKLPIKNKKNCICYCIITIDEVSRIDYADCYGEVLSSDVLEIIGGRFPNLAKLFSEHKKQGFTSEHFGLNANYMAVFSKVLKRESFPIVKIHPKASDKSVLVSFQRVSIWDTKEMALIMPARI